MEHVKAWALPQAGVVARWQLIGDGVNPWLADAWGRPLRTLFPGVYVTGWGPVTPVQRWWAATLTAPGTVLGGTSAGAFWGFGDDTDGPVTVIRPGTRGPDRLPGLAVSYSATLVGNVVNVDGLRVTSAARTVIDLWSGTHRRRDEKLLREAVRRRTTSLPDLGRALDANAGRRGVKTLRATIRRWKALPLQRCRSDAEAYGLTVLQRAGVEIPLVNAIVAGFEADYVWPGPRRIIELDGPQWHRFRELDAAKTAAWEAKGYRVARLPTGDLYRDPGTLLRLAPPSRTRTSVS